MKLRCFDIVYNIKAVLLKHIISSFLKKKNVFESIYIAFCSLSVEHHKSLQQSLTSSVLFKKL